VNAVLVPESFEVERETDLRARDFTSVQTQMKVADALHTDVIRRF
jgi:hypothetical protein